MFFSIVLVLSYASAVMGGCGKCEIKDSMSSLDKQQANAFNKMPADWKKVSIPNVVKGFVTSKTGGFGPNVCDGECLSNWGHGGRPSCTYKTKAYASGINGNLRRTTEAISFCTTKYHDRNGRLCRSIPQWNDYWKMWCHTWHSGRISNWGNTHYPFCSTTNQMCIPS